MTAISSVVNRVCTQKDIEFVFYDTGPNIGPLNRAILLDCDYFIIPVAYDLFSVRALKTLGRTLHSWVTDWRTICQLAPEDMYLMPGSPRFLGYIPQNFRIYGGTVASQQGKYSSELEKGIQSDIVALLKKVQLAPAHKLSIKLGEVKDFKTLVVASQRDGTPIYNVAAGNPEQRKAARAAFRSIAEKVIRLAV